MKKEQLEEAQVAAPFASLEEAMKDQAFQKWVEKVADSGIPLRVMGSNVPNDSISDDLKSNTFGGVEIGVTKSLAIAIVANIIRAKTDKFDGHGFPYELFMAKVTDYMYNITTKEE